MKYYQKWHLFGTFRGIIIIQESGNFDGQIDEPILFMNKLKPLRYSYTGTNRLTGISLNSLIFRFRSRIQVMDLARQILSINESSLS